MTHSDQNRPSRVKVYVEYFNHTLGDYLTALRTNRCYLHPQELAYIVKTLAESALILRSTLSVSQE